ncbi:MAG: hypothetical protein COB29_11460, partial [Sulfitobacter sp.]
MISKIHFKLNKNAKTPVGPFANIQTSMNVDMKKYNRGIRTGKISNITGVDLDYDENGQPKQKMCDFIREFGTDYIQSFNTLTQRTPKGGIHLLFQYEADLRQTQTDGIDIRSDNGYLVYSPSSIDGVQYEIINDVDINKMPTDVHSWLLNNLYRKKKTEHKKQHTTLSNSELMENNTYLKVPDPILEKELESLPDEYVNTYNS